MPSLPTQNRRVVLAERPDRGPITEKTFHLENAKIGDLEDGQILVKVLYTSIVSSCQPSSFPKDERGGIRNAGFDTEDARSK